MSILLLLCLFFGICCCNSIVFSACSYAFLLPPPFLTCCALALLLLCFWSKVFFVFIRLIHRDAHLAQLRLCLFNLAHELLVCLGAVVKGQHAPAEADEKVSAKGNEGPKGELFVLVMHVSLVILHFSFGVFGMGCVK